MVATAGRVRRLTTEQVNTGILRDTESRIAYYAAHPEEIGGRLRELDEEWDIERAIEMESAGTVFAGFFLGVTVSRKWFLLSVFASAMLLLHNLHGTYPLLPIFRRLGFRTAHEIARERYALKALRGDFEGVSKLEGTDRSHRALAAAHADGSA